MNSLIAFDVYGVNFQMAWFSFRKTLSDEEHVDAIRRAVIICDHMRPWLIALHVLVLIGFAALVPSIINLCAGFAGNNNGGWVWMGLAAGLIVGISIGYLFGYFLHGVIAIVGLGRTERLLVRYHDALQESLQRLPSKGSDSDNSQATDG